MTRPVSLRRLLNAVHKTAGERMPEAVEPLLFDPGVLQDLAAPLAEVERAGVDARLTEGQRLIAHEQGVSSEAAPLRRYPLERSCEHALI